MIPGTRKERDMHWPASDRECAAVIWNSLDDLDGVVPLCRGRSLVVQAGGNCGVWARHLAGLFDRVVTFEPDPLNFACLVLNTAGTNVTAFPAALGDRHGWCDLDRKRGNAGAHTVRAGGSYPVMAVDSLGLPACDLLYLDIEGSEPAALRGALDTIRRFRPVIAFEEKGLSVQQGSPAGSSEALLLGEGYRVVARPARDVVMVSG